MGRRFDIRFDPNTEEYIRMGDTYDEMPSDEELRALRLPPRADMIPRHDEAYERAHMGCGPRPGDALLWIASRPGRKGKPTPEVEKVISDVLRLVREGVWEIRTTDNLLCFARSMEGKPGPPWERLGA